MLNFNRICLNINKNKTTHIKFTPNNRKLEEEWTSLEIPTASSTKFLGVVIDQNLNWQYHIDHLSKKLASAQYVIRRIRTLTNEETSLVAYHALFHSHLRYGIAAWGSTTSKNMDKILIMQKKIIRTMLRLSPMEHCKPHFTKLNILTVISQYILETIILAKNSAHTLRTEQHAHNLRNTNNIDLPQHHLQKFSNSPFYAGSKFHNQLPDHIKSITNTKTFISTLKQYLNGRPYYSISEYTEEHTYRHFK
uniref:Reverse transcriptase domain-containing protein n=1 Tax=Cuerna arida TaxID=1464854 RepID=A0A1B6G9T4_9HEMI